MSGAKKLTTVKIGANIMTVGAKAFCGCSKLSNVTIFSTKLTTAKTGANAFKGIRSNCRFKVPASRVSAYKKLLRAKGAGPKIIVTK
ncbi:MAG: leucine-rich repeat protein [Blautia sp.]|nr:leucine-rich repeat protein [Blautia sp.]